MNNCSFCDIARGSAPARVVYETQETLAFFPLAPAVVGHTLVIPRAHIPDIWSLSDTQAGSVAIATLSVARAVRRALRPNGMNIINSNGAAASQTVEHLHFHVVPRWDDDDFGAIWPTSKPISAEIKDDIAQRIRSAVSELPTMN